MRSMSTTPDADAPGEPEADRTIPTVAVAIGVCAALLALASYFAAGGRFAFAVVVGGAIGAANFLVLARVGKALTGTKGGAAFWGGMYFFKIAALFGGLFLLLTTKVVDPYGLLVGLASLVPGIVVGGVVAARRQPPAA